MAISYTDLAQKLQGLEAKFRCTCTPGKPCSGHALSPQTCTSPISFSGPHLVDAHIRMPPSAYGGNCQFFALDTTTAANAHELPVVIAVGANYTQNTQQLPSQPPSSPLSAQPCIEESLTSCRTQLKNGLTAYSSKFQDWQQLAAAGINMTDLKEFHLVMTNFCPWVTDNAGYATSGNWDALSASVQAELLTNALNHQNSGFVHLDALLSVLNGDENVYWCAHGLHSGVFPLFRMWQRSRQCQLGERWILLNNLSRRYGSYNKVFPFRNSK